MNAIVKGKVFRSGNSAAVRLPKELGFEPGTEVTIEKSGLGLTIRPAVDPEAALRKNQALAAALRAAWADAPYREVGTREPFEAPDRPGLI
ncbi:antitoxin [uncultured Sphingomonas sp.]|uniref:antitoxin n=1 Tax=uncultured Sphingomonas sp. TaxID=158754 RepID=UPI0035CBF20E